jgi:hypothetical protein
MKKHQLLLQSKIQTEFPNEPTMHSSEIMGQTRFFSLEADNIAKFLSGKRWQSIDLDCLSSYRGDTSAFLNFISDKAYLYFFPAFLMIGLKEYSEANLEFNSVLFQFRPPDDEEKIDNRFERRVKQFTSDQLKLIHEVFCFIQNNFSDEYEAKEIAIAKKVIDSVLSLRAK